MKILLIIGGAIVCVILAVRLMRAVAVTYREPERRRGRDAWRL